MIGSRLIEIGGARLVGALAVACLTLAALLCISVWGNWTQAKGRVAAVGAVLTELATVRADARAQVDACAAANGRQEQAVAVLEAELLQCRGQEQSTAERLALALRERDRARRAVDAELNSRQTLLQSLVKSDEACSPRPMCRAVSERVLDPAAADGRQ